MSISIIIPCKNEEESIYPVIREIELVFDEAKISHEIIVVDNNSTDSTKHEAEKIGSHIRIVDCATPGYGAAIMHGIQKASHPTVCMIDGDWSYNPRDILRLLDLRTDNPNAHIYMGNRFSNGQITNIKFLHRIFGVPMLNWITNTLYRAPESYDSHCGLRLFDKKILDTLQLKQNDFSFANEMVCKALKNKLAIIQTPITLRKDLRVFTTSKIKTIQDGFYALKTIVSSRF
ncbi:MAG: glycosyltransferase family 2 protein [Patescibacteria group bacterium]